MTSTERRNRSLVLSGIESVALHHFLGLAGEQNELDSGVALDGLQRLVSRGVVNQVDGRYQVSADVADLLGSYVDPEWSVTWASSAPSGAALVTVSVAGERSAVRVAESDDRQAYAWIDTSAVLPLVADVSQIDGYRAEATVQLPVPTDKLDEIMAGVAEADDSATFCVAGQEMEEVLTVSVRCARRGVAVRSTWVKGADRSLWHLRDLGDEGYCLQGAAPNDVWHWLNQAQHAVVHDLEPGGNSPIGSEAQDERP